jgi:cell division protein FtsW
MISKKIDLFLLGAIGGILIFGILILTSVSATLSSQKIGTAYYYLNHQLISGIIPGIILGFVAFRISLKWLKKIAPYIFLLAILLMILVFIPKIGFSAGGASRWIHLGFTTVQPSEFLKLAVIIYLASWLSSRTEKIFNRQPAGFKQTFFPFVATLMFLGLLLYMQPDLSTFGIIAVTSFVLFFLANTPIIQNILLFLAGCGGLIFLAFRESYRANRISVFFNSQVDPLGIGYQLSQAKIAIGSGGIFGLGLGMSQQKYGLLPEPMSDSIFAVLAEETGFIGGMIVILLFALIFWRGFKIAMQSSDKFSKLLAFGITFWILIQTLINISSMIGLFPLAGIPLPLFSYGGSAIIAELTGLGLLLNVSRQNISKI